jgi:hypothetical protein
MHSADADTKIPLKIGGVWDTADAKSATLVFGGRSVEQTHKLDNDDSNNELSKLSLTFKRTLRKHIMNLRSHTLVKATDNFILSLT